MRTISQPIPDRVPRIAPSERSLVQSLTGRLESWTATQPDVVLQRIAGMLWGITGGLLSGQTITYAKSTIALLTNHQQFVSFLFIVLLLFLASTAVAQIVALNKGLHAFDSTVVVPTVRTT